jgi:hypothetical protein
MILVHEPEAEQLTVALFHRSSVGPADEIGRAQARLRALPSVTRRTRPPRAGAPVPGAPRCACNAICASVSRCQRGYHPHFNERGR